MIERVELENGVRFILPPIGFIGGLGCFSVIWNAMMTLFTAFYIWGIVSGFAANHILVIVVGTVFWLIGIGSLNATVQVGRNRAEIEATPSGIRIEQSNEEPKSAHIPSHEIKAIRTQFRIHDVAIRESWLEIQRKDAESINLFKERKFNDVKRIASELRDVLGVGSE